MGALSYQREEASYRLEPHRSLKRKEADSAPIVSDGSKKVAGQRMTAGRASGGGVVTVLCKGRLVSYSYPGMHGIRLLKEP